MTFLNMPNTFKHHPYLTEECMDLFILAIIGKLNSLNGSIPQDSSNPKLNHPILSTTTSTINDYASSFC
jgi:hypothetical protein